MDKEKLKSAIAYLTTVENDVNIQKFNRAGGEDVSR